MAGLFAVSGVPGGVVHSIAEDTAGNLWIANQSSRSLSSVPARTHGPGKFPGPGLGHKDHATALAADPSQGGLWLGFFNGGLAYFADGQVRASYAAADGLGEGRVNGLRFDPDGCTLGRHRGRAQPVEKRPCCHAHQQERIAL